jgi:hypothetical protein
MVQPTWLSKLSTEGSGGALPVPHGLVGCDITAGCETSSSCVTGVSATKGSAIICSFLEPSMISSAMD